MNQLYLFFKLNLLLLFALFSGAASYAQVSDPLPFLTRFTPKSAIITDIAYKDTIPSNAALIRLPNGKVAYMTRTNGKMEPFYIKAIETGYWDTRYEQNTNYDTVFADMREMGANTAYVMLHWEDIEPADANFDYTFADSVVAAAKRQGLKIGWVLFLHAQRDKVPTLTPETAWTFHLDDRDSANYTMQWVKRNGQQYNTIKDILTYGIRPLHVYGHPEIFYRIRRMLYNLGTHYRNDDTVIGVQVGNEEGFSFLDESDFNPVTTALYETWKQRTNKTDYAQFKKEAIDWWWQQFTSAYHEADPYKILSFNLDAGQAEAGDKKRTLQTGTSAATYADGNLDAIGTMLYKGFGYQAILGLDHYYGNSYQYQLPILVPSEIGIGVFNSSVYFRHFVAHSLERAAQGFGVYCYGEVRKELPEKSRIRKDLIQMFTMIHHNENLLYAGLPGPGAVSCRADSVNAQVSHLNVEGNETLAMIYFPESKSTPDSCLHLSVPFDLGIACSAQQAGKYKIRVYQQGVESQSLSVRIPAKGIRNIKISGVRKEDIVFINISKER